MAHGLRRNVFTVYKSTTGMDKGRWVIDFSESGRRSFAATEYSYGTKAPAVKKARKLAKRKAERPSRLMVWSADGSGKTEDVKYD